MLPEIEIRYLLMAALLIFFVWRFRNMMQW